MQSQTTVLIEYWSSLGEVGVIINGTRYVYSADLAVIKRFLDIYRNQHQPFAALNYLKTFAQSVGQPGSVQ